MDGINIRDAKLASLRNQMGIVTQETILFNETIEFNITYGVENHSQSELESAAQAANAFDFILGQPKGFQTIIGEKGVKLSGGQRQRLAIARAILRNPPILILDEATSSLDTESERKVQTALEHLMKDRTTLVIAHRLSTVTKADKIVVLDKGEIRQEGTHADLIIHDGLYRNLYNIQFD
jgi:subfamily B ATP-binding cassette protein MsbA